ncbi:MAG: hypothetical protein WEB52_15465 [Dehalococcoidia bacterium]
MLRVICTAGASLLVAIGVAAPVVAGDETPTPVASPTAEGAQLAAPTDLRFDGDAVISWTDNAIGEDEYQVVIRLNERQNSFSLPADSTSIVIPDVARVDCTMPPFQGSLSIDVYATALDLAGDAASLVVAFDCAQAFATPTAGVPAIQPTRVIEGPPALPDTGSGGSSTGAPSMALALLALAAVGAATTAIALGRHHR